MAIARNDYRREIVRKIRESHYEIATDAGSGTVNPPRNIVFTLTEDQALALLPEVIQDAEEFAQQLEAIAMTYDSVWQDYMPLIAARDAQREAELLKPWREALSHFYDLIYASSKRGDLFSACPTCKKALSLLADKGGSDA